jgi:hypothetical protein
MPAERLELGLETCMECSPKGKPRGVMVYSHKTGGVLEITESEEAFQELKRSADSGLGSL